MPGSAPRRISATRKSSPSSDPLSPLFFVTPSGSAHLKTALPRPGEGAEGCADTVGTNVII